MGKNPVFCLAVVLASLLRGACTLSLVRPTKNITLVAGSTEDFQLGPMWIAGDDSVSVNLTFTLKGEENLLQYVCLSCGEEDSSCSAFDEDSEGNSKTNEAIDNSGCKSMTATRDLGSSGGPFLQFRVKVRHRVTETFIQRYEGSLELIVRGEGEFVEVKPQVTIFIRDGKRKYVASINSF